MIGTSSPEKESEYPTQEEIDYDDMVWLTKKSVREKLEKWRKEPTKSEEKSQDKDKSPPEKICYNCYFCSRKRVVNKVPYIRCSFKDPQWVISKRGLSCWKPRA